MISIDKEFSKLLKGKKISAVRRLTKEEMDYLRWYKNPLVLIFSDKTQLILQCDDEGNNGGAALFFNPSENKTATICTI